MAILVPQRVVNWDVDEAVYEPEVKATAPPLPIAPVRAVFTPAPAKLTQSMVVEPKRTRNRIGNGHKKERTRNFFPSEKKFMIDFYKERIFNWTEGSCTELKNRMSHDISLWQVVGFISTLRKGAPSPIPVEISSTPKFTIFPSKSSYHRGIPVVGT